MRSPRNLGTVLGLVAAAALVAASCGDDGGGTAATTAPVGVVTTTVAGTTSSVPATTAAPSVTMSPQPEPGDDQAVADAAIAALEAELEAAGYTAGPDSDLDAPEGDGGSAATDPTETTTGDDGDVADDACAQIEAAFPSGEGGEMEGSTAQAETADYERGDPDDPFGGSEFAAGFVGFVDTEARLDELFELFEDETLADCLAADFEESMGGGDPDAEGPPVQADVDVEIAEPLGLGDDETGIVMRGSLGFLGFDMPIDVEIRLVRVGRAAVGVAAGTFGEPSGPAADVAGWLALLVEAVTAQAT
jgi:hypothetical protein